MQWNVAFRIGVLSFAVSLCLGFPWGQAIAQAQQAPTSPPPAAKIQELINLLDDPEIRAWLQTRTRPDATDAGAEPVELISRWEAIVRGRFVSLYNAVPRLGAEMANAATVVTEKVNQGRHGTVLGIIILLIAIGYGAEWLFRRLVLARVANAPI